MYLKEIELINFRNYEKADIKFNKNKNLIIGENAQGKTNLVEAAYLCAFSRSFRTSNATEFVKFGKDYAIIRIKSISDDIERVIDFTILKNGKKMVKIDGKPIKKTADLLNNIVVVIFSPEDIGIIKDSPDKRRIFIDKELCQIRTGYYECLKNYKEALKNKNILLKNKEISDIDGLLDVYDEQIVKYGSQIIDYRSAFIDMLADRSWEIQNKISNGKEKLEIKYKPSSEKIYLRDRIKEARKKDKIRGYASVGPHRDDIEFYINDKDAHKYASQGQQRTVALSLKLAEVKLTKEIIGENPILILDDVLSELDLDRQNYLMEAINDIQLLMTATEVNDEVLEKLKEKTIYCVHSGEIKMT